MGRLQYLRLISIAGAFVVGFWLPVRWIGFQPSMMMEIALDLIISATSLINIFLYFQDHEVSPRESKSWMRGSILLDLVCVLPLAMIAYFAFERTLDWILLLNLATARHIRQIRPFLDDFDSLQPIVYRLVPLALMLPLLVHLIACGWIALGAGSSGILDDRMLTYVQAVYWTFTTLTTVGYGDIVAKSIPQMLYACGVQVIGVGVFGYILSNVAGLLARSDAAREHHMDNLDKVEMFMKMHHIPQELRGKIRAYYHYLWTNKKGYQDRALLEDLPGKIQSELFLHINRSIIEKVPFLRGAEREMLSELMNELKPRIFVPGERIFRIDDAGDALYFIHSGSVEIIGRDDRLIANLADGAFFGEMALLSDQPRTASVRATTYCDLYCLSKDSFKKVSAAYPEFLRHIHEVVRDRNAA